VIRVRQKFPTFLLKLLISISLIVFFLWRIDFTYLLSAVRKTKVIYLAIGFLLYPIGEQPETGQEAGNQSHARRTYLGTIRNPTAQDGSIYEI
jgi:hypothetical protein